MVVLTELIQGYCQAVSLDQSHLLNSRRTDEIVRHRMRFVALVMKKHFPECLSNSEENNPEGLLGMLSKNIGGSKPSLSKLAHHVRFYYRMHSRFRNEVDELEKLIDYAA